MSAVMPLPKYHQIYLVLREQLREGLFKAGLPSEMAFQQQFGVARVTVRRALEQLAAEGLISRQPGRGTLPTAAVQAAAPSQMQVQVQDGKPRKAQLTGLLENLVSMGLATTVKVLDVGLIAAPQDVAQALQVAVGDEVQKAVRVRSTKAGPFSHITTYIPQAIGAHFGRKELAKKPILLLLEEAGVQVGRAEQTISARLADVQLAQHLDVAVGSALLAVRRLIFDMNERPVQWLHGMYRPDRYEYVMQLSRVGDIDAKVWVSKELSAHFH
jgi:GntR family transcriptional regulator